MAVTVYPERLKTFFHKLESRKTVLTTITHLHKTLTDHFSSLEQSLSEKFQTLDSQIEAFEVRTNETLESLQNRENAIPEKESSAAARIKDQTQAAISDIKNAGAGEESCLPDILRVYCRRMDVKGLIRFLLTKRRDSGKSMLDLRTEVAAAVEEAAVDPRRLVLEAVEEFVEMRAKKAAGMANMRWACGILVQAVVEESGGVARCLREKAAEVLEKWKVFMEGGESEGTGAGEATMFLQMVVRFGLKQKFGEEFLEKLVVDYAARKEMAKVALALDFGDKIKDIIDLLVKKGKKIEAVYFIYECGLKEQIPPVPLVKDSLSNCRKIANEISRKGHFSAAAVNEANYSELNATKVIMKCIEDYKLESEFGIDSLRKRVAQLEKAKSEKKRSAPSSSKPSNKRSRRSSRPTGRGGGPPSYKSPKVGRFSMPSPSLSHTNPYTSSASFSAPYSYGSHGVYDGPPISSYGQGYGGGPTQSPPALPRQFPHTSLDLGSPGTRALRPYSGQVSYSTQGDHGAYSYGGGAGSAYTTYHL